MTTFAGKYVACEEDGWLVFTEVPTPAGPRTSSKADVQEDTARTDAGPVELDEADRAADPEQRELPVAEQEAAQEEPPPMSVAQQNVNEVDGWVIVGSTSQNSVDANWRTLVNSIWQEVKGIFSREAARAGEADAEFVCVAETPATVVRSLIRSRPFTMRIALWVWMGLLGIGTSSTTIWWCRSLSAWDFAMMAVYVACFLLLALLTMHRKQVATMVVAFLFATMPSLASYSAVHLILSSPGHAEGCLTAWLIYGPRLLVFGTLHLAGSLLPVLHAEHPNPGYCLSLTLRVLEILQKIASAMFRYGLWIYLIFLLYIPLARSTEAWEALTDSRELALMFHTLGVLCQRGVTQTQDMLGDDFLPCLIGTQRARAFNVQALTWRYGGTIARLTPYFRRWVPPRCVVAYMVSLRQMGPVIFPAMAVLPYLVDPGRGGLNFAVPVAFMLALGQISLVVHHYKVMPQAPLQQLPLLLPSGVPQRIRTVLGHVLVGAERIEGTRSSVQQLAYPLAWLGRNIVTLGGILKWHRD